MNVHSEEKLFNCDHCGKSFKSQGGLKQHQKGSGSCKFQDQNFQIEEPSEEIQHAYMVVKDGEHFFQLEDGQILRAEETIYTLEGDIVQDEKVVIQQ